MASIFEGPAILSTESRYLSETNDTPGWVVLRYWGTGGTGGTVVLDVLEVLEVLEVLGYWRSRGTGGTGGTGSIRSDIVWLKLAQRTFSSLETRVSIILQCSL